MKTWKSLVLGVFSLGLAACSGAGRGPVIYRAADASPLERLAASEIRRYLYLTTGTLSEIRAAASPDGIEAGGIVVAAEGSALLRASGRGGSSLLPSGPSGRGAEEYRLKTLVRDGGRFLLVSGGDGTGVLYGAYALAVRLGVRFSLDGDVVPDEKIVFRIPDLDETHRPLFARRGIQPFHDFAEGPDWWNEDTYKAVIAQLPKLRMNFFGLHTYPEGNPNAEPGVWIGLEGDARTDGRVLFSYPSSWQNTRRSNPGSHNWGYQPKPTGRFRMGTAGLFESDDFGPEIMEGLLPEPTDPEGSNRLFDRAGLLLRGAFSLARRLGVKTGIGTETPLTIPALVRDRLAKKGRDPKDPAVVKDVYRGIFRRIQAAYPLDLYWFWTTESWTWSDASDEAVRAVLTDLEMAMAAARETSAPFALATCGWVLGPPSRRTLFDETLPKGLALTCINREVGKAPVDPAFARISGRPKWAIPWMEDDPALTSPQLWAGRMRRDAADARRYGCDGLLGIHWRTRILSPNVQALAGAAWEQDWNTLPPDPAGQIGPLTGQYVKAPEGALPGEGETAVYRDVRDRVFGYRLLLPDGDYTVTLKFCETEFDRKGARVFDVLLQGRRVAEKIDIFERAGRFRPFDLSFDGVPVRDGYLALEFADRIHYPSLAAIVVQGLTLAGGSFVKKINCGGPAVLDYDADWAETERHLPALDLYQDWARAQFGRAAAAEIAALFAKLDGRHPVPVNWTNGPGGIRPDPRRWADVAPAYAFVEELRALRPKVAGAGSLERFDYWLKNFEAMRETARLQTSWADYNKALEKVKTVEDPAARAAAAKESLLPPRVEMVKALKVILGNLAATASNTGEMGTIANWEQHLLPDAFDKPGLELKALLGGSLPDWADLPSAYEGTPRIVVATARTSVEEGEALTVKAALLAPGTISAPILHWRPLGRGAYQSVPLQPVARSVYRITLPVIGEDFEYYIRAKAGETDVHYPVTAPALNQSVVIIPKDLNCPN